MATYFSEFHIIFDNGSKTVPACVFVSAWTPCDNPRPAAPKADIPAISELYY